MSAPLFAKRWATRSDRLDFLKKACLATLPFHHTDPFDRLLIAQAIVEGMRPVSNDKAFDAYPVQRFW